MTRTLYDLAGAEADCRFSPFCWRIKMALAHKGLAFNTVPWRFTDKDVIAFSGQGLVPVLKDGEHTLADSWAIATYLEDAYPDAPSLFGGPGGRATALLINSWGNAVLLGAVARTVLLDIHGHLHEKDRAYFRETREKRFGKTLEQVAADQAGNVAALRAAFEPVRMTLKLQPYLGGVSPLYPDYIVFSFLQWARAISAIPLLAADDPVAAWRDRLLDAFGGLARQAPAEAA
jgi:glutathione S-transferase